MKRLILILAACACCCCASQPAYDVTLESLLDEMISFDAPTAPPTVAYRAAQTSSYDRRTVAPDSAGWFANDDGAGYERLDTIGGRVEKVLFEQEGPGAVTRIWMTTLDKRGTLRFYFDGANRPSLTIPAYDMSRFPFEAGEALSLTHTHYVDEPSGKGGNTFFLPIPYARSCKITFEEPDYSVKIPRYYHIGYRIYEPSTAVETFSISQARRLAAKIAEVNRCMMSPETFAGGIECTRTLSTDIAHEASLPLPGGAKAVRSLRVHLSDFDIERLDEIMSSTFISMDFDGVRCVDVPLDCFFGAGSGAVTVKSRFTESDGAGDCLSRWVMPYAEHAVITLSSCADAKFAATLTCHVDDFQTPADMFYFHAAYRDEKSVAVGNDYGSNDNLDWNFTTIAGRGIYCGDVFSLYNHCPDWYGEGDEKIWVDDDTFPSFMGTGTEDYYNCSWAPVVPFATPFGGAPRADSPTSHGYNTFFRTRNLDVIPFSESLTFDLEMLSWTPGAIDCRAAAFWYGTLDSHAVENR